MATQTRILPVNISDIGSFSFSSPNAINPLSSFLSDWTLALSPDTPSATHMRFAAESLRRKSVPVAFPTETVYGLAADATRSSAVRSIYAAKNRPPDNPLIVHFCSLSQLKQVLQPRFSSSSDPIPEIYYPLIRRFWPGPLTILLPNPTESPLAPEVTANLATFGARIPSSLLALALIQQAGVPLAAPSANASTRPSPTTAQHVLNDLDGRIEIILDGGPCEVGVESTVVDGLVEPPVVLRPGGVGIEQIRECEGWKTCEVGYKDRRNGGKEEKGQGPKAPGMKYRHYSPKAKVLLIETGLDTGDEVPWLDTVEKHLEEGMKAIGVLRTKRWKRGELRGSQHINGGNGDDDDIIKSKPAADIDGMNSTIDVARLAQLLPSVTTLSPQQCQVPIHHGRQTINIWDIGVGPSTADVARGLFSALRGLDERGVEVIFVEGIDDSEGEAAAAVMNRLRKAAEIEIES
ncbi:hypothetical protein MMC20_000793 [Loxospora ochrophaea]|nr:hypothetical protein [Loxospora ochrophaea]